MKLILKLFYLFALFFYIFNLSSKADTSNKDILKIGLIVPLSGKYEKVGYSILNSLRMGLAKIDDKNIIIYPRDNYGDPKKTLQVANELNNLGIKIIIGPVFKENLDYLNELKDMTFFSLSNQISKNSSDNIIYTGINALSQFKKIISFLKKEKLTKTIVLIPRSEYEEEIRNALNNIKYNFWKIYSYDVDPQKLTKQIQQITKYPERKNNLKRRIKILENSNLPKDKKTLKKLKKRDTLGNVNFDSVIIADFDQNLKSVTTSFLYSDVSTKKIKFITLNQWFDDTLFKENSTNYIYFPSIDKKNFYKFKETYFINFNEYPTEISILSYDILGLIYFLNKNNELENYSFSKKKFKGTVSNFEINKNITDYDLQLYQVFDNEFKKIN